MVFLSNKCNALLGLSTSVVRDGLNGGRVTTRLIKIFKNNKYVRLFLIVVVLRNFGIVDWLKVFGKINMLEQWVKGSWILLIMVVGLF